MFFKILGIFPALVFQLERANRPLHLQRLDEAKLRLERLKNAALTGQTAQSFHSGSSHTGVSGKSGAGGKDGAKAGKKIF